MPTEVVDEEKPPYVPTAEELRGNTWAYCYGQPVVIEPPKEEDPPHGS